MRTYIGQSTSESERSYPVVPDRLETSERAIPSDPAAPGRVGGRIIYSTKPYRTAYTLRLRRTRSER
jgi:hypothetical protein